MPHKRRDVTVCASHGDTLVDTACKVSDTVLKVMVYNLHDVFTGVSDLQRPICRNAVT